MPSVFGICQDHIYVRKLDIHTRINVFQMHIGSHVIFTVMGKKNVSQNLSTMKT